MFQLVNFTKPWIPWFFLFFIGISSANYLEPNRSSTMMNVTIWNGVKVQSGYRFMANMRFQTAVSTSRCSGVLVKPNILISAGHCFRVGGINIPLIQIYMGSYVFGTGVIRYLKDENPLIFPDGYDADRTGKDIVIIKLKPLEFDFGFPVETVEISKEEPEVDQEIHLAGWGFSSPRIMATDLLGATMIRVASGALKDNEMATVSVKQGSAGGDSGSPIMFKNKLAAIVIRGTELKPDEPPRPFVTISINLNAQPIKDFLKKNNIINY